MTAPPTHSLAAASSTANWMQDRLSEARGVLADTTQHPKTLVIIDARFTAGQIDDAIECTEAVEVLCPLDPRPLDAVAAAAFPKGGAA